MTVEDLLLLLVLAAAVAPLLLRAHFGPVSADPPAPADLTPAELDRVDVDALIARILDEGSSAARGR